MTIFVNSSEKVSTVLNHFNYPEKRGLNRMYDRMNVGFLETIP